eukprot:scaffold40129_cov206-Amphora_coffeaeformis.AAC.1
MTDVVPRKQHQQQQKLTTMDDDDIEDQEVESSSSSYASSSSQLPSPTPHPTPPPPPPPSCGGRYCCYGGGGGCHNIDDYGPVVVTANAVLTLAHFGRADGHRIGAGTARSFGGRPGHDLATLASTGAGTATPQSPPGRQCGG